MKCWSIFSVTSKSAITPSFIGRMAMMLPGVRPSISLASLPTASTLLVTLLIATMEGSLTTMPRPLAYTRVFAVPRSMARSLENRLNRFLIIKLYRFFLQNYPQAAPGCRSGYGAPRFFRSRRGEPNIILLSLFGFIHCRIRQFDQLFGFGGVLGEAGNSKARRQIYVCAHAPREAVRSYVSADSFGHLKRAASRRFRQHQHEFIAAVPGYEIRFAHGHGYHFGHFRKSDAACAMAVGVVDQLETVQVHEDHGYGRAVTTRAAAFAIGRLGG